MAAGLARAAWRWVASARLELRAQVVVAAHSRRDRLACAGLAARALRVAARHGQGRYLPAADARQAQAEHRKLSERHSRVCRGGPTDALKHVPNATSNWSSVMTLQQPEDANAGRLRSLSGKRTYRVNCGQKHYTPSCVLTSPPLSQPRTLAPSPACSCLAPALAFAPALRDDGPLSGSSGRSCRRRRGRRSSCRPAW